MKEIFANPSGSAFSDQKWLDTHHAIKSSLRADLISKLSIRSGESVADIGCGTGTWSLLAADQVGPRGSVFGIDPDIASIKYAQKRVQQHYLRTVMRFAVQETETFLSSHRQYDVILLFNTLSFLDDPARITNRLMDHLTPGGRLFIKDTDILSNFFWPDPKVLMPSLYKFAEAQADYRISGRYDPFFARKIPKMLRSLSGVRCSTITQAFSLFYPLTDEERDYVRGNAQLLAQVIEGAGEVELAVNWLSQFDRTKTSLFEHEDFLFSMTEFVFEIRSC